MKENKADNKIPANINSSNIMDENSFKPKFHFSCPEGWMNDPNGFSFFNGEFHLYYQHYPFDTKWGPMHWGHATSRDLLHWTDQPIALYPESPWDNQGCFSGTALTEDDHQILIYTGVTQNPADKNQNIQQQCIAINDGKTFSKLPQNPVIRSSDVKTPFRITDFRDPKIFKEGSTYYCASVIMKNDGNGAIALFSSTDLIHWKFLNIMAETNGEIGGMWECPDFFTLDGKDVIIVSPQSVKACDQKGFHDGNNSVYMTGNLDRTSYKFTSDICKENNFYAAEIDYGIDFYAPQTMLSPDGRRIMIAWLQAWESYITPQYNNWSGMMTLPRQLSLKNNRLYQNPVSEYEDKIKNLSFISGTLKRNSEISFNNSIFPQCELSLCINIPNGILIYDVDDRFTITIYDDNNKSVNFSFNLNEFKLMFDRKNSINNGGNINSRYVKIPLNEDGKITFRFIFDTFSAECFINEGMLTFTNAYFLNKNVRKLKIESSLTYGLDYKFIDLSQGIFD